MAGEKDVLRALVEEARERGAHPDREAVFAKFLGDDGDQEAQEEQEEQEEQEKQKSPAATPAEPKTKGGK
jgi:hypothetical protein